MNRHPRIYLSPPHVGELEQVFVAEAFESNWVAPVGPHVDAFEKEMAEYVGTRGAVAVSSGTAAIHLALRLLEVGTEDIVFCSTLTFIGGASPILYLGATPVFIDSDDVSWNLSIDALQSAFNWAEKQRKLPKAVIVANLYGQSADFIPIFEICRKYRVPIIEDAAESLGATYGDKPSGAWGDVSILSFNGNKIITTSGGGMLLGNNAELLKKAKFWSTQAREPAIHYEHREIGYNYRLSNILAAIGRGQLRNLDARVLARRQIFERYQQAFCNHDEISFMPEAAFGKSTRWLTVLTLDPRKTSVTPPQIVEALGAENIEARPVWKPLHQQPVFQGTHYFKHETGRSVSDQLFERGICLPSGSNLTEEQQQRVIDCCLRGLGE